MIPFMTEALMLFPPDELWTKQLSRKDKYWIHGCLFTLGTILVSAGSIDTFIFTAEGYHLYTIHGITGLISMILFILSILFGVMATYSRELSKYSKHTRPVWFKFIHNFLGLLGYVVGVVSLCYSYYSNWFVFYTSAESRLVALIATILGTLWTMNGSIMSGYDQIKTLLRK
ncbi:hypothetical protein MTP99_001721 [Tenebrio molitor]|nr:hypothetical protein MTP99_001720 [Tenebrio molitor]KAJ3638344.1 hypothetical protein MTP99_001721 [Tenebrio molitor]